MPQRRAAGFRIHPEAWRTWEGHRFPGRLEDVIDAVFGMADAEITLTRLSPAHPVWKLIARIGERTLSIVGKGMRTAPGWRSSPSIPLG